MKLKYWCLRPRLTFLLLNELVFRDDYKTQPIITMIGNFISEIKLSEKAISEFVKVELIL